MPATRPLRFLLNGVESAAETYFRGSDKEFNVLVLNDDGTPFNLNGKQANLEWFTTVDRTDYPTHVSKLIPGTAPLDAHGHASLTFTSELALARGNYFMYLRVDDGTGSAGQLDTAALTAAGAGYESIPTLTVSAIDGGSGATLSATILGGLKRIDFTTPGSGYMTSPTVVIGQPDQPGGVLAAATVTPDYRNSTITACTVLTKGTNFTSIPGVSVSGSGGSGHVLRARMAVITIPVSAGGSGYTTATVNFTGGTGTAATATANITAGAVSSVTITTNGEYTVLPVITITGDGTGATVGTPTYRVESVEVLSGGTGWNTSIPTISFSGGGGSGATAVCTVTGGTLPPFVNATTVGSGYTAAPTVTLYGGIINGVPFVPAVGAAKLNAALTAVNITAPGSGYHNGARVTVSGGNPTTAATVALTIKRGLTYIAELASTMQVK